jgi:aminoglycoside phosphotransferase
MKVDQAPPAEGARLPWAALPGHVRAGVEALLGAPVAAAADQRGGFSPGAAARLRLADGSRAFVKAVSPAQNPESPDIHRREARIAAALPSGVPAPRLLASFDADDWVVLAFEDVDGRTPHEPWRRAELDRVLAAMTDLAKRLTPSPLAVEHAHERFADDFGGWRRLAESGDTGGLDPWAARNLERLADLESGWRDALAGDTLSHCDLRADNVLLTSDGGVVFVDWPWATVAVPWFDLLFMLPSVAMRGGVDPEAVFTAHPLGAAADPDAATAMLAAFAGFMLGLSFEPPPPGLPTLRPFQRAQGEAALAWLRRRVPA